MCSDKTSNIAVAQSWYSMATTEKGSQKSKRFETEDIQQYKAVEMEEDRMTVDEINDLQVYMCNNLYTEKSPNKTDSVRKRNMFGEDNSFHFILLWYSRTYLTLSMCILIHLGDLINDGFTDDDKQKFKEEKRVLITVGVRELELRMRISKSEGGYEGA